MANLVDFVNNELSTKKDFPAFGAGDTITVYYEIKEGEKTRTQFFTLFNFVVNGDCITSSKSREIFFC